MKTTTATTTTNDYLQLDHLDKLCITATIYLHVISFGISTFCIVVIRYEQDKESNGEKYHHNEDAAHNNDCESLGNRPLFFKPGFDQIFIYDSKQLQNVPLVH